MRVSPTASFISQEQLDNLKLYKYAAIDRSPITKYILQHYWNWAVEWFPRWMAPNLITLIGLGYMIFNVMLCMVYATDLTATGSCQWIYYSFAIGLWTYSTCDNVDGKQARRTGSSSPLGELFDHGCDALQCALGTTLQAASLGLGQSVMTLVLFSISVVGFYLSTVEEYHTGVLYLGYINVPTEGVLLSCVIFIISGWYGPRVWQQTLDDTVSPHVHLPSWLTQYSLGETLVIWVGLLLLTTHLPTCLYAMSKACSQKGRPFVRTMVAEQLPMVIFCVAMFAWATSPYSVLITQRHLVYYILTLGFVFGHMASRVILAHVTRSPFPTVSLLIAPLVLGAVLTNLPRWSKTQVLIPASPLVTHAPERSHSPILSPTAEAYYLAGYLALSSVTYISWAMRVTRSICYHLGIQCFRITPPVTSHTKNK